MLAFLLQSHRDTTSCGRFESVLTEQGLLFNIEHTQCSLSHYSFHYLFQMCRNHFPSGSGFVVLLLLMDFTA